MDFLFKFEVVIIIISPVHCLYHPPPPASLNLCVLSLVLAITHELILITPTVIFRLNPIQCTKLTNLRNTKMSLTQSLSLIVRIE